VPTSALRRSTSQGSTYHGERECINILLSPEYNASEMEGRGADCEKKAFLKSFIQEREEKVPGPIPGRGKNKGLRKSNAGNPGEGKSPQGKREGPFPCPKKNGTMPFWNKGKRGRSQPEEHYPYLPKNFWYKKGEVSPGVTNRTGNNIVGEASSRGKKSPSRQEQSPFLGKTKTQNAKKPWERQRGKKGEFICAKHITGPSRRGGSPASRKMTTRGGGSGRVRRKKGSSQALREKKVLKKVRRALHLTSGAVAGKCRRKEGARVTGRSSVTLDL